MSLSFFKENRISRIALLVVFLAVFCFYAYIQFITPVFYDEDGYYHAAVARAIKESGPRHEFRWAQFSTFQNAFSDKDFLFHLLIVPFLFLSDNIVLAGKYAVLFYNALFLLAYIWVLRKYVPDFLVALLLLLLPLSATFSNYFLCLRSFTLANIFTVLGIYFLINKNWLKLFFLSILYPLAHISFYTVIIFALACEGIRYAMEKNFFRRNLYAALLGTILGCLIHPNNPNNWLSLHLNGFLVPLYTLTGVKLGFGSEFFPFTTSKALFNNLALFISLNIILWGMFFTRIKFSFSTIVWWACFNAYLVLSFFSNRYWYVSTVLFFVFFAAYLKDWIGARDIKQLLPKVSFFAGLYLALMLIFISPVAKETGEYMRFYVRMNKHYENAARWMRKNIPAGETVYHAYWSDSPYFICLNPKNNYLVALDPIYMFYSHPKEYLLYKDLEFGRLNEPYRALKEVFKAEYGYTRDDNMLYKQITGDDTHFRVLYKDNLGIIFKVL